MIVTLIGYRGSGKSTIAAPLAERLGCNWVDSDDEIEQRAQKTIREIFKDDGEPHFRQIEREVLRDLLAKNRLVIAAGGGAILDQNTRLSMRTAGLVVWLSATVETLVGRIFKDPTTGDRRPSLTTYDERTEVATVLKNRLPLYREAAHKKLDVDTISPDDAAFTISKWVRKWPTGGQSL